MSTTARNAIRITRFTPGGGLVRREVFVDLLWDGASQRTARKMAHVMCAALASALRDSMADGTQVSVELDPNDTPFRRERTRR